MKKLFVQFYLLLFVCFLVMTMLVGLVYKFTAERAGRQSLDDLMKSSLYLMRSELREIPPRDWSKTLKELDLNLSFDLHIEPISKFKLSESSMQHLRAGDIVALDDQYTFIQRIPRSHYVLSVGPVPYLYFLHEMRLLDVALMAFIAISLAFPVFIWMRPHWQDMLRIETAAQRFGEGHLSERIHFDSMSSFERLGVAFNQMADNINALIASKKQLIDGIAHELRTPLVRLRYHLRDNFRQFFFCQIFFRFLSFILRFFQEKKILDIAFWTLDWRKIQAHPQKSKFFCTCCDLLDNLFVDLRFANDPFFAHLILACLKLWFYQTHHLCTRTKQLVSNWKYQCQRNKRYIHRDKIDWIRNLFLGNIADVGALQIDHTLIGAQGPRQLAVTYIHRVDLLGSVLQHAVGKSTSRCADINADAVI